MLIPHKSINIFPSPSLYLAHNNNTNSPAQYSSCAGGKKTHNTQWNAAT